jgi:pyruvate dehydrogenase E2 component (dihydrolipoyllysine-residue acetyltransferase)
MSADGLKGEVSIHEPDRGERTVLRRSAEARATVPDLELVVDVDMSRTRALEVRSTALLVRASALALRAVPRANASYRDGHFELYSRINVGVTVTSDSTYAIPTVLDADRKSLRELDEEIAALSARALAGELTSPELSGATFTVLDMGSLGVWSASPLVIPPQAAAIAAGAIRLMPAVRDAGIVPTPMMTLTLGCDHRILYGARAAGFLEQVRAHLEEASL